MRNVKVITMCLIMLPSVMCCASFSQRQGKVKNIRVSILNETPRVGEPLLVQLGVEFERPVLSAETNQVVPDWRCDALYEIIKAGEDSNSVNLRPVPGRLTPQDNQGIHFEVTFPILYDHLRKTLAFDKPGTYTVRAEQAVGMSCEIEVTIDEASSSAKKALELLSDPNDFFYLEFASHELKEKRPERMSHLKKVVEQCEETILAKWCAARLGLEYFSDFHKKHRSFEKFREKDKKAKIKEPLLEQAQTYLTIGAKLPEAFPIREDVLKELVVAEFIKGNDEKANSILDELGTKYPKGKHGRKASQMKQELREIQKREKEKAQ